MGIFSRHMVGSLRCSEHHCGRVTGNARFDYLQQMSCTGDLLATLVVHCFQTIVDCRRLGNYSPPPSDLRFSLVVILGEHDQRLPVLACHADMSRRKMWAEEDSRIDLPGNEGKSLVEGADTVSPDTPPLISKPKCWFAIRGSVPRKTPTRDRHDGPHPRLQLTVNSMKHSCRQHSAIVRTQSCQMFQPNQGMISRIMTGRRSTTNNLPL